MFAKLNREASRSRNRTVVDILDFVRLPSNFQKCPIQCCAASLLHNRVVDQLTSRITPFLDCSDVLRTGFEIFSRHLEDPSRIDLENLIVELVLFEKVAVSNNLAEEALIVLDCVKRFILSDCEICGVTNCSK